MANQVVQLIDNDNNNIYPVAGALKDGSVTTSTINDNAVTAAKIDFASLAPGALVTNYGQITSTTTITPSVDGYLVGKSVIFKTQASTTGSCYITDSSAIPLAGIPYAEVAKGPNDANLQVAWTLPVVAGVSYTLAVSGDGSFEWVRLRGMGSNS